MTLVHLYKDYMRKQLQAAFLVATLASGIVPTVSGMIHLKIILCLYMTYHLLQFFLVCNLVTTPELFHDSFLFYFFQFNSMEPVS